MNFLNDNSVVLLILLVSAPLLAYFHLYFKPNEYHRMIKKFESMNDQKFMAARKTYARLSKKSMQAYSDVELNRIIKKHNLNQGEINLWLRKCMSMDWHLKMHSNLN